MKKRTFQKVLCLLLFGLCACNPQTSKLTPELQKVIDHYSQSPSDSLKLRAAWFLISNMDAHKTLDSKELRSYYAFFDTAFQKKDYFFRLDSIYKDYLSKNPYIYLKEYPDKQCIKAKYLIKNIDQAFVYWHTPWTRHLSFQQFCEYILPYRIDDEILESWRDIYKKNYATCFVPADYDTLSALQACAKLNNKLKEAKSGINFNSTYVNVMKPSSMINLKFGTCMDYSNLGVFAMRSFGIPVAIDHIPSGHSWNVVITSTSAVDFTTSFTDPGTHIKNRGKWEERLPKVFRDTYSINPQSLIFSCGNEDIPPVFKNPCYIDVTAEYFHGADIHVDILKKSTNDNHYLYLCQYFGTLKFADWAKIKNNQALFKNMGDSIVYIPVYYNPSGLEHAAYPILIKKKGKMQEILKPDIEKLQTMVLYRKFPIKSNHLLFLERAVGGIFQGANHSNFSDAQTLYRIEHLPEMKMTAIKCNGKSYRYVRYLAPDGSHCSLAEIQFLEKGNTIPLKGKILGTDGCYMDSPMCTKENVFDGDLLTYFDAPNPNGAWVGLDLGTKKRIEMIKYITRNDDNGVQPGEEYELLYMGLDGWVSMGTKIAQSDSILYNKVPRNALYLLKDLTKGKEERIFTYEKGKQVWW